MNKSSQLLDIGVHWNFTLLPLRLYGRWKWLFYKTHSYQIKDDAPLEGRIMGEQASAALVKCVLALEPLRKWK